MKKNKYIIATILAAFSLNIYAQNNDRNMQWIDVTMLNNKVIGNTNNDKCLKQYLLFDETVIDAHSDIMEKLRTCTEEIQQQRLNEFDQSIGQITDETIAKLKNTIQEQPELAEQLNQQIKNLEQQRKEYTDTYVKEIVNYTYPLEETLKEITNLAVNQRAYSDWYDMGNGLYAVLTGESYGPLEADNFKRPKIKEGDEYTWGAINYDGKMILEAKYSKPISYPEHDFIILSYNQSGVKKCGACGYNGKIRVPFVYNSAFWYGLDFHFYIFEKDNKYGFISLDGKELQPCIYEKPEPFGSGWCVTKDGKNYGLVDHINGKLVIPLKYKYVWNNKLDEIFMQRFDKKIDVYNENGFNLIRTIDEPED